MAILLLSALTFVSCKTQKDAIFSMTPTLNCPPDRGERNDLRHMYFASHCVKSSYLIFFDPYSTENRNNIFRQINISQFLTRVITGKESGRNPSAVSNHEANRRLMQAIAGVMTPGNDDPRHFYYSEQPLDSALGLDTNLVAPQPDIEFEIKLLHID